MIRNILKINQKSFSTQKTIPISFTKGDSSFGTPKSTFVKINDINNTLINTSNVSKISYDNNSLVVVHNHGSMYGPYCTSYGNVSKEDYDKISRMLLDN